MEVGPARGRVLATAVTAAAQVAVLLGAAAVGVLIAARFGTSPATDGFFAANAVYGIALFVAQSFRTTAVTRVMDRGRPSLALFNDHVGAALLLFVLTGVVFALLMTLAAPLITSGLPADARRTMQLTLAVLWPAAGLHLFAGLGAAMLAAYEDYATPALAYGAGAVMTIAGYLALVPTTGVTAVPLGLASGAATVAGLIAWRLWRHGWRPPGLVSDRSWFSNAGNLLLGAVALIAAQVALAATVAFAARTGEGGATLYSYALMAVMVLTAGLASPITVVYAPVVARMPAGQVKELAALSTRTFRLGVILLVPATGAVYLAGQQPAAWLLRQFSADEVSRLFELVLVLAPSVVAAQLVMVPLLGVLTEQRYVALGAWSGLVVAAHIAACAVGVSLGGSLTVLAGLSTATSFGLAAVVIALAFRRTAGRVLVDSARAAVTLAAPGAGLMLGAAWLVQWDAGIVDGLAAAAIGSAAFAAFVWSTSRSDVTALLALRRS